MSRFFSEKYSSLKPYTPGEQPQKTGYVKLNTNESPFPPSPYAVKAAYAEMKRLELYPDPECAYLRKALAATHDVNDEQVIVTNGSDEALLFAFMAFCDETHPAAFADITYGFYSVFANLLGIKYTEIPLNDNFNIIPENYFNLNATIFIANPNAPTGIALDVKEIERILRENQDNIVVIDEAYADFANDNCVSLLKDYENLLIVRTFSKSRSMAGARLGYCLGAKDVIKDLNTLRYSTNPYNVNRMTMAAGAGALEDKEYFYNCLSSIRENRAYTKSELEKSGFTLTDSQTNFLFARHDDIGGKELYEKLKQRGIFIRHFDKPRIGEWNRISVGTMDEMNIFLKAVREILEEKR